MLILYGILNPLPIGCRCLEAIFRRYSVKKVFVTISQNSQENASVRISRWLEVCYFIEKKNPIQVVFFCEIFKNIFFIEHLQWLLLDVFTIFRD